MTLLPMENKEGILCALKSFEKDRPGTIPPILEDYIKQIARDGRTMLPWVYIKPLLLHKFNKVIDGFLAESSVPDFLPLPSTIIELRQLVYSTLKKLDGIPFTIQRICELLENPFRHYNRPDKYLRGLEKVCAVVSTIDPQGNKIHREDPRFPSLAGLDEFGSPTSGGLQASPPSPCVDDLHRPHTSKSSDVDVVTDDDENEDEEDDDGTESSSHGSCTPPGGVSSISQTSVLTAACESGSWPFVANRLTLSPVLKPPLRDLAPDKLSSIENAVSYA
ncbi:unnamed protein product [Dicrocoelium dendriticum]|nr:unnamed protein product [Dicrocoelium dendriticum]